MPLHNEKPNTERLDKLASEVLVKAIEFERCLRARTAGDSVHELCNAVVAYREALVAELIGTEPTWGG